MNGATILVRDSANNALLAPAVPVDNQTWSTTAYDVWGPTLSRLVRVVQQVGGQDSASVDLRVTIPPLAPTINDIAPGEGSPLIEGTCWPNAVVKLKYSDSPTEYLASVVSGRWTHRREEPFVPGSFTVMVTQAAAQQTSPPASKPFTVLKPIPKPTIDPLDEEVGRDLIVTGDNGLSGATMQLRDAQFGSSLGPAKRLTADGRWSIELTGLAFRPYTIDAQQTFEGRTSQRSEQVSSVVVLLPPKFDAPQPDGSPARTSEFSGTGMPGGWVEVWLEGASEPLLKDVPVGVDGRWKAEVTLPIGLTKVWARQFFEVQTSRATSLLSFKVVPAAPIIETPADGEHIGRQVTVSGFGYPGDTVAVSLDARAGAVLVRSPVLEDRTWSVKITLDHAGGNQGLVAVASSGDFDSATSDRRLVVLGTYLPSIDAPAAGRWVSNPVVFKGQGRLGVGDVVSWFNPDLHWAPDLVVEAGSWQGAAAQPLPEGGSWCRFKQTITDASEGATVSDWVESKRFDNMPPSMEP